MKRGRPIAALLAALFVVAGTACAAEPVSFSRDLVPLLRANCATCHLTGDEQGNMKLHPGGAYAALVGVPSTESSLLRVRPGEPDKSYLMHKLDGTHLEVGGQGEQMPFGQSPLDEAVRNSIRAWIASGAKNN